MNSTKRRVIFVVVAVAGLLALLYFWTNRSSTPDPSVGPIGQHTPAAPSDGFVAVAVDPSTGTFTLYPLDDLSDFSVALLSAMPIDGSTGSSIGLTDFLPDGDLPEPFDLGNIFPVGDLSSLNALDLRVPSTGGGGGGGGSAGGGGGGGSGGGGGDGDGDWTPNPNLPDAPPAVVPLPATVWLLGTSLLGLMGLTRRKRQPSTAVAH